MSQTRVIAEDKMATERSTHEYEKFIGNVRRQISANGPLGRRRCRARDNPYFQCEDDERTTSLTG